MPNYMTKALHKFQYPTPKRANIHSINVRTQIMVQQSN